LPIDPKLLEILACPACRTEVTPTPDGAGLRCASCGRRYPIVDDIPVMLVEEATIRAGGPEGRLSRPAPSGVRVPLARARELVTASRRGASRWSGIS
jgi:uncharacterized protein YbaR (Trm112 family)